MRPGARTKIFLKCWCCKGAGITHEKDSSMTLETSRSNLLQLDFGGPDRLSVRGIKQLFALILLLNLAGCFSIESIKPYPESWSPPTMITAGQCPDISGQYVNEGSREWDAWPCPDIEDWSKAGWNCDAALGGNLVKMKATEYSELLHAREVKWVKLKQPDPDTLEVYFPPDERAKPKIFKRSKGDFECDSSGLKFSMMGSAMSLEKSSTAEGIKRSALMLTALAGAIVSTERVFRPLQDGSLSMEATQSNWVAILLIFDGHGKHNAFVRWQRYQPPSPTNANSRSP